MDAENIDENMTVPHPSRHQTTASITNSNNIINNNNNSSNNNNHHQGNNHPLSQQHYPGADLQHLQQISYQHEQQLHHLQQQQQHHQFHQQQQQHHYQQHHHQSSQQQHQLQHDQQQQYLHQQQQQQENKAGLLHQHDAILEQLMILVQKTQQTEELVKISRADHQEFVLHLQSRSRLIANITYQESLAQQDISSLEKAKRDLNTLQGLLKQRAAELNKIRCNLLSDQREIFDQMSIIQHAVLFEHLPRWHQDQQLANNGFAKTDTNVLDQIQIWVERLIDITWRLRIQLKGLHQTVIAKPNIPFNLEDLRQFSLCIDRSLENLVLNTFVVEKQPPQVMKTNTRFTSTVRFLSGTSLNAHKINPTVKVTILSESNARAIIQSHQKTIQTYRSYLDCPPNTTTQQQQQANLLQQGPDQVPQAHSSSNQQHLAYSNISPSQQPPSTHQSQQQQFFQQHQPPQPQFHVQPTPAMTQYQHVLTGNIAYCPPNTFNMNEFEPSGEILNNSNILEYQENTHQLISHFRNMQLKKIKRTEKKGTESVMDEKFVLLFHTDFRIADDSSCSNSTKSGSWIKQGDLWFRIMAFSLPVVVIVHGNQEPHAWATVTWHNAFARPDELLYQVPDKVCWRDLGQVLSEKFRSCAGKGLSAQNLEYLASKVYRNRVDNNEVLVSWNQFAKEPLPDKSFTFWEWFHSILKLTKEHLRDLWNADRIYGFVGKKGCVDLLLGSSYHEPTQVGTFLLRYSETELGGITIAWVSGSSAQQTNKNGCIQILQRHSPTNSSSNVLMHLQPFVSKDLNTRSLADRIRDLEDLVYLYPDISKDDAFRAYYTPLSDTTPLSNGYIKPMLIQTLVTNYPKNSAASSVVECAVTPATPSSFSQSSPDGIYQDNAFMSDMDSSGYPAYDPVVNEFNNTLQ